MRFEKVSEEQYLKDSGNQYIWDGENYNYITSKSVDYSQIKLPKRSTRGSAGYDFFSPIDYCLKPGHTLLIATGIKASIDEDKVLFMLPRSGHGFKARIQLDNTIGVIDSDYYNNKKNEGHILIKITNDSNMGSVLTIENGSAFCQGIILPYFKMEDDESEEIRAGGIGSTDAK